MKNDSKGLDIISFASVNWDVLPCLNVMAQFNYKHGEQITDKYFPKKYSETGVFNDGYGSIDNWKDDNIVFEAYSNRRCRRRPGRSGCASRPVRRCCDACCW